MARRIKVSVAVMTPIVAVIIQAVMVKIMVRFKIKPTTMTYVMLAGLVFMLSSILLGTEVLLTALTPRVAA